MNTQNGTAAKPAQGTVRPNSKKPTVSKSNTATKKVSEVDTLKSELEKAQTEAKQATDKLSKIEKIEATRKPLSIADALVKVTETKAVADRLEFLQRTRKELSTFALGSDGNRDVLSLRDGSGNHFESHNSETIGLVLELLKSELFNKISEAEKELLTIA